MIVDTSGWLDSEASAIDAQIERLDIDMPAHLSPSMTCLALIDELGRALLDDQAHGCRGSTRVFQFAVNRT